MAERRIGRYQVLERVAAGMQATVYRARDTDLGREVALKVLHPHLSEDAQFRERFLREARMAASISHPNVIVIHEIGEDAGSHYIAMEFLPSSLDQLLKDRGRLPVPEATEFVRQIGRALQAAHNAGVIHRDLKPLNILITHEGDAKVADFGIARAAEFSVMTATGAVLGTPLYMSPEQAKGEEVDTRSDLYSLGVMFYEMVTGRAPFANETPQSVMRHHLQGTPVPLDALQTLEVSGQASRVIRRALASDKTQRYQSADDLVMDLVVPIAQPEMPRLPEVPDFQSSYQQKNRPFVDRSNPHGTGRWPFFEYKESRDYVWTPIAKVTGGVAALVVILLVIASLSIDWENDRPTTRRASDIVFPPLVIPTNTFNLAERFAEQFPEGLAVPVSTPFDIQSVTPLIPTLVPTPVSSSFFASPALTATNSLLNLAAVTQIEAITTVHECVLRLEVADTSAERLKGLSERESLPADQGMLFVFDIEQVLYFWMKGVLIPLDIAFLNEDFMVLNVQSMIPEHEIAPAPLPTYTSPSPAMFALVVNAGIADKCGIAPDVIVNFAF